MIKGLFIEDDDDNVASYSRRFKLQGIELITPKSFPSSPDGFWNIALENDVDFIIIDNHLHKKSVKYSGLDVLKEIRKQDSEIYIMYLTSKGISREHCVLSNFDLEIDKNDFSESFETISKRIKRATSRELAIKNEREINKLTETQEEYYKQRLEMLRKILG